MTDSSSSSTISASTDGLSFILEESSDNSPISDTIVNNENALKLLELATKISQIRQQGRASSSRRPRKKKRFVKRDRQEAYDHPYKDYFADDSIYNETHFRRRFRIRKHLFFRIVGALESRSKYFQLRYDSIGRRGLLPLTKCAAAMHMLAYCSNVLQEVYEDRAPKCEYVVNDHKYNIGYYLSDGIYPKWATVMKTISLPQGAKAKLFAECQESIRKDVEKAFGVPQARFAIIRSPVRNLDKAELGMIMKACIILHNMIVEDERDLYDLSFDYDDVENTVPQPNVQRNHHPCYAAYLLKVQQVHNPELHARLQADLVEEIWRRHTTRRISQT